jgi:drug/metabolite transporter (DMT)-like permease
MLAFISLLWGSSFLFIKISSQAFDPTSIAFGRAGIAAAALVVAALAMRVPWPRQPRLWGRIAAMSLFGQALPFLLLGVAAHLTTSADMALMMGGVPIFTFLLARLFALGEVWNARAAFGLALGLLGVVVSLGGALGAAAPAAGEPGLGRALALVAALGYASGALMSRAISREIGPTMAVTGSMLLSAGLLFGPWLVLRGSPSSIALLATPVVALVALGLVNTALAYFVYFRLIASAGATFAALNNYIVPVLGMIAGALALGEPVGASSWLGLACVLGGVVLTGSAANAARVIAPR